MYSHRSTRGPVDLAFTDRYGGVSVVPYDSLNLALEGGDDPEATAANLTQVLADFAPGASVLGRRWIARTLDRLSLGCDFNLNGNGIRDFRAASYRGSVSFHLPRLHRWLQFGHV